MIINISFLALPSINTLVSKHMSLLERAQEALTIGLLKWRPGCLLSVRLQGCLGLELEMISRALPAAGLRPECLEFMSVNYPVGNE